MSAYRPAFNKLFFACQLLLWTLLAVQPVNSVQPNYAALLSGSSSNTGGCCAGEIQLRQHFPDLTHTIKATIFPNFKLHGKSGDQFLASYHSCAACSDPWKKPDKFRLGMLPLQLDSSGNQPDSTVCKEQYSGPTIVMARHTPVGHFGHQMHTLVPALTALKLHLALHEVDATQFPILLVDGFGPWTYTAPNARTVLEAIGFTRWITPCRECLTAQTNASICVEKAIVISFGYYGQTYVDRNGRFHNIWERPRSLMDTDPIMMHMVESVRRHAGLPGDLPFAPTGRQLVVVASRSAKLRQKDPALKGKIALKRILLNEEELLVELAKLPDVDVKQVDFGTLPFRDMLDLMANTSLFLGYHGTAIVHNTPFVARGGWVLEIMPRGSPQRPLCQSKAFVTGKFAARYYNEDPARESCWHVNACHVHDMNLKVDISEVIDRVQTMLKLQRWQLDMSHVRQYG